MKRRNLAAVVGAALLVASCTTVPNSSPPQVVQSVALGHQDQPLAGPGRDDPPRDIVSGFLTANAGVDANHNAARSFLTKDAKSRWSDGAITTIIDNPQVGNLVGGKVTVSGREIGTIDDIGVYTPALRGDGDGTDGAPVKQSFGLTKVKGQWRIDSLQQGLLISQAQFQQYQQRVLYFFDVSEEHLVPDPRYTQIADPHELAQWLITGLAQGPRDGLQTGFPNQPDPTRDLADFTSSNVTRIEIPGSSGLPDIKSRDRLGAQVARTLAQAQIGEMQITDSGRPVRIPAAGGTTFSSHDLASQFVLTPPQNNYYYLNNGAAYDEHGRRVAGKIGTATALTALALSPQVGSSDLLVAALRADSKQKYLDLGTPDQLTPTRLHGDLSRPAWAPDVAEVWIGDGPNLYRLSRAGALHSVPVDTAVGKVNGRVTAVRLSPEGSRVALVLTASDHTSQIYVGSVVRSSSDVRVANLTPVSPQGVAVRDVAWNDELKLFAIGTDLSTNRWGLYEVQCDGSRWTLRSDSGLPQAPDSLTVAARSVAVVSTGGTIWRQQAGSWEAPVGAETRGTNPVYVE